MPVTQGRGRQIRDDDVGREDINVTTAGRALIRKIIAGTNIGISFTGADVGTGDVTVNLTGTVAVANGGTGATSLTGILVGNGTSAVSAVVGTASQLLRRNAGNTAYEFFTPDFASITAGTVNVLPKYTSASGLGPSNISDSGTLITLGSNSVVSGSLTTSIISASAAGTVGLFTDTRSNIHTIAASFKIQNNADTSVSTLAHNLLDLDYAAQASGVTGQYVRFLTGGTERVGLGLVNDDFVITTAATTRLTVTQGGNLGLGTTAPAARIHARDAGTINTQTTILHLTDTSGGTSNGAAIDFSYSASNILNARIGAVSVSGGGASLTFGTAASDGAAITNHVFITKLGNVLVGTPTDNGARFRTVGGVVDFQGTATTDGGQLGTELLTSANWTSTDWTGDFATGFTHTTGNTTTLTNTLAAAVGTLYQLSWTVTNRTAGSFTVSFGGYVSGSGTTSSAIGPRATSTANLVITPTADFNGTIVMSIRIINSGNASLVLRNSAGNIVNEIRAFNSNTNTSTGIIALHRVTTGVNISAYGNTSLTNVTSGPNNSGFGVGTLAGLTIGSGNLGLGVEGGRYINNGSVLTSPFNSIFIGNDSRASADGNTNEIVIGTSGRGNGSNTVTIGNSSIINNFFSGAINANKYVNSGVGTFSAFTADGQMQMYVTTADGLLILARGATNDFVLGNKNGSTVFNVPTGTRNIISFGDIVAGGTTASTSTTTGALRSAGGLGVAGAAWIGGTVNISGHLTATSATFTNAISVFATSGAIGVTSRGRATDNFFISEFRDNTGATRYGYVQSHSDFGGTLAVVADGGARIDLDSRGVRVTTGSFGVGTATIEATARLQVDSTTQGVLFPRMTVAQRLAISSPANGLIVTQTDGTSPGLWIFISSTWRAIALI